LYFRFLSATSSSLKDFLGIFLLDELCSLPLEDEECLLLRPLAFLLFLGPDESLLFPEEDSLSDSELSDEEEEIRGFYSDLFCTA
jgi:hypothetical protein